MAWDQRLAMACQVVVFKLEVLELARVAVLEECWSRAWMISSVLKWMGVYSPMPLYQIILPLGASRRITSAGKRNILARAMTSAVASGKGNLEPSASTLGAKAGSSCCNISSEMSMAITDSHQWRR